MAVFEYFRRVRYFETDPFGAAHHSRVYLWFEEARTEFLRLLGKPYGELEASGLRFPVRESGCRHRSVARFDELLRVTIERVDVGGASLRFAYRVGCEDRAVAEGYTLHACVGPDGRVRRLPDPLRRLFQPPT
jgi:acyl-CoA thioester hydrolase